MQELAVLIASEHAKRLEAEIYCADLERRLREIESIRKAEEETLLKLQTLLHSLQDMTLGPN